jgi:predicted nucleic acid-binding protein
VLAQVNFLALSDVVVDQAAAFPQEKLRSLDALHLASALRLGTALTALVTYDRRLAIAAAELDLTVAQPT